MAIDFIQSGITLDLVEYVDTKPIKPVKAKVSKDTNLNPLQAKLFEVLRLLRKQLADDESIPPYMIFGDATLVELVTSLPFTVEDFGNISGVGIIKKEKFGSIFVRAIEDFCDVNTDLVPTQNIVARPVKLATVSSSGTIDETLKLFNLNKNIELIAKQRKLSKNTVIQHIIQLRQNARIEDIDYMEILNPELLDIINAEKKAGINFSMLTQWKNHLKAKYDTNYEYDDIKLCLE
jgi:HRDC domain/Helix-turn-helix domain